MRQLEMRMHVVLQPMYGRRGIAKMATAQTLQTASRSSENQLFCVPPTPACDERPDIVDEWMARARRGEYDKERGLPVHCVHCETEGGDGERLVCQKCICDAVERLQAVATNSVALSSEESLSSRGQRAIWRTPDGNLKSELFKDYCRGELEATLAAIAMIRKDFDTPIATPLFAAQDPNLFWPLVCHHGSIRAALEHVAPHVSWTDSLGPAKFTVPDPSPIVASEHYDVGPGCMLRKCGNNLCFQLEPDRKKGDFLACGSCGKRLYCSRDCLVQDWPLHKRECVAGASKPEPIARFPERKPKKQCAGISANEEVVVHGLQAKPEYNGKIGRITGSLTEQGRYPVELFEDKRSIAVKPLNLDRLGVEPQYSRKKGRKFRCVHSLELCNDCQLDLVVVNRLWKLFSTGESLLQSAIEEVGEYHFASLECKDQDGACEIDQAFPMEAQGFKSLEKKLLLKSILKVKEPSETTAVAINGLVCYSSRDELTTRPYVPSHCVKLVQLWNKG